MKLKQTRIQTGIVLTLAALLIITAIVFAQSGDYTLSWWTVDNGGGTSSGGTYAVNGTLGQPDAGSLLNGGQYGIQGGFWAATGIAVSPPSAGYDIYLPLIVTE